VSTPDYEDVLYEVDGGRATITINRPDRLNAFRFITLTELTDAFERAADDPTVGVVVLTGAGDRAFCAGADVRDPSPTMEAKRAGHAVANKLALAMRNNGKPVIARVRGYAIGAGNELNILCDLTVSGTSGRFGQAGPKIGMAPLWWGSQLLPAIVGEKKARELLFITRQYTAEEALAMGLVNAVVPDDELDAEVDRWCEQILQRSPQGLRLAKIGLNAMTDALYSSTQHGLELMALNHIHGPEPQEGFASFRERRAPDWRRFRGGAGPEPGEAPR
jgi:naphthoate synthase/2-ketocyclohexanecarboxyl-CoA hydrolase